MREKILILAMAISLQALAASSANAQNASYSTIIPASPSAAGSSQTVDGIAARIDDDILTESEVRELGAFQTLVDGQSKSRAELLRELEDQWLVRGEAAAATYPEPSTEDVDRAYSQLEKQFASPAEFKQRCAAVGLSEAAVRRLLQQQLYLSRFLDFRFRPAAQVTDSQIEEYYTTEFALAAPEARPAGSGARRCERYHSRSAGPARHRRPRHHLAGRHPRAPPDRRARAGGQALSARPRLWIGLCLGGILLVLLAAAAAIALFLHTDLAQPMDAR